jgi:poly(A) polymerase
LRAAGYSAWLVGGCVRDRLLGQPVKDEDVATSARPDQVLALFPAAHLVGAHFGVVLAGGVEIATYRSESSYGDGRHPERVTFETSPEADAARRDFTINALFLDPESGEVLDFHGGREDLRAGVIRAVGDPAERFREDHLRMLRAVRFAARLDFTIHPATAAAIQDLAPLVQRLAAERVRDELNRMFTGGRAGHALRWLDRLALLAEVLPEVKRYQGVEQPPEFHPEGDVWTHTCLMMDGLLHPSPALAWGVLLHDAGKPDTFQRLDRIRFNGHVEAGVEIAGEICRRLRFPAEETRQIQALVANHMRFGDVTRMKESTLKRFLRLECFEDHLELHRLDCQSSHGHLDNYRYARERWEATPAAELRAPRLVTGNDLMSLGFPPGPGFREALAAAEDVQLEGGGHAEALEAALKALRGSASEGAV